MWTGGNNQIGGLRSSSSEMPRSVTLHIDDFGREALDTYCRQDGSKASAVVGTAVLYYLADQGLHRPAWRVPALVRHAPVGAHALEVELDDPVFRSLEQEAVAQGVAPERLAEHALTYFLADVDSGRLADRLGDALGGEP